MDGKEVLIKEYQNLRGEITQIIGLHNTLLTFAITATIAVLSFVFAQKNIMPFLFLLPFCIIIPMSMRIAYYRTNMAKISAYLIVFLENEIPEMNWETRNNKVIQKLGKKTNHYITSRYLECLLLCIVCYVLFIVYYLAQNTFSWIVELQIIWPFLFVLFEVIVTKQMCSVHKERDKWIEKWKEQKENENS